MKAEYTLKEASEYLGMKYEALRYLVTKTMKGPICHMDGNRFVFKEKNLHAFRIQSLRDKINRNGISTNHELKLETEIICLEMSRVAKKIKGSVDPGDQWEKLADAMKQNSSKINDYVSRI